MGTQGGGSTRFARCSLPWAVIARPFGAKKRLQRLAHQIADLAGGVAHFAGGLAFHLGAGHFHDGVHDALGGFGVAELVEHHADGVDGGDRVDFARAGVLRRAAAHGLEHADAFGVDVAAGGDAHAALDDAAEVGDDVAEHVRGDDHVVELGVLDDPHAAGVDVVVVFFDVGIFLADLLERAPPEVVAEDDVRFGDERDLLAFGVVALLAELEGVTNATLASAAGVESGLRGDFVRRAFVQKALDAAVEVLGVFADDDEVDVVGAFVFEGRLDAGKKFHRAEVDVLVEAEAEVEEELAFEDAGGDIGVADGAEEDGVELAKLVEAVVGERAAGFEVAVAGPIEVGELEANVLLLGDSLQYFDAFGGDFRAGAVSADDGDFVSFGHEGAFGKSVRIF